jgi:hypothetical protein
MIPSGHMMLCLVESTSFPSMGPRVNKCLQCQRYRGMIEHHLLHTNFISWSMDFQITDYRGRRDFKFINNLMFFRNEINFRVEGYFLDLKCIK